MIVRPTYPAVFEKLSDEEVEELCRRKRLSNRRIASLPVSRVAAHKLLVQPNRHRIRPLRWHASWLAVLVGLLVDNYSADARRCQNMLDLYNHGVESDSELAEAARLAWGLAMRPDGDKADEFTAINPLGERVRGGRLLRRPQELHGTLLSDFPLGIQPAGV